VKLELLDWGELSNERFLIDAEEVSTFLPRLAVLQVNVAVNGMIGKWASTYICATIPELTQGGTRHEGQK